MLPSAFTVYLVSSFCTIEYKNVIEAVNMVSEIKLVSALYDVQTRAVDQLYPMKLGKIQTNNAHSNCNC